jgi:hypothetical protein
MNRSSFLKFCPIEMFTSSKVEEASLIDRDASAACFDVAAFNRRLEFFQ